MGNGEDQSGGFSAEETCMRGRDLDDDDFGGVMADDPEGAVYEDLVLSSFELFLSETVGVCLESANGNWDMMNCKVVGEDEGIRFIGLQIGNLCRTKDGGVKSLGQALFEAGLTGSDTETSVFVSDEAFDACVAAKMERRTGRPLEAVTDENLWAQAPSPATAVVLEDLDARPVGASVRTALGLDHLLGDFDDL